MPIHFARFEPDHESIGRFLRSEQLRDAVREGAQEVARIANDTAGITKVRGTYAVETGPDVVVTLNGNRRLSEEVVSYHPAAAADEFGSGQNEGGRPQGGSSPANRTLGKAGDIVGDHYGEG